MKVWVNPEWILWSFIKVSRPIWKYAAVTKFWQRSTECESDSFNSVIKLTKTTNSCRLALTGPTGQPSDRLKPLSFLLSWASWKADYLFVWIFPPWDLKKLQHTRVNILDLKILQVFFKNRGEILVFEKLLNFLSFLVLLYVSGHSKQKIFFQKFSDW